MAKMRVKPFLKYLWRTFREGRFLLLKFVISAVLMIVITVLSNLLNVHELTYLNAVLAIDYFTYICGFGVSEGVNMLVNQNIKSKTLVRKYVRAGVVATLGLVLLLVIIFVSFPKLIMESLTNFVPQNYTFYYIMCIYAVIRGIRQYVNETLKGLKIFTLQFISEILSLGLLIAGFSTLLFAGAFHINSIAIAYIVCEFAGLVLGLVFLAHNKIMKVNIFTFGSIQLTKKQWWLILCNPLFEFIWEIGNFSMSLILIRMSEAYLNTYSYLENVTAVFNSLFYTFVSISGIRIARCLGSKRFERAFDHAKKSLFCVIFIWAIYFALTMLFIYPIALGVNKAYFALMFTVTPIYCFIHLIRFLLWNFGSYMLRLGGQNGIFLVLEVASSSIFVLLASVVSFLPVNVFLAYFLIILPEIIVLPIYFAIFLRKKWMKNLKENSKLQNADKQNEIT